MGLDDLLISTGVDALIKLLRERGRIDIRQAAVALKLPMQTVEDWTHVLESEGLIKIEYQLTNVILVWVQQGGEELKERNSAVSRKKNDVVGKIESIQTSVQQSQVELSALQEQMTLTQNKTREQMDKLARDLANASKLGAQASDVLSDKRAQIKQMQDESEGLRADIARFEAVMKEISDKGGNAGPQSKMKKLADAEERMSEKLKSTTGVFDSVGAEMKAMSEQLNNDRTAQELEQIKKTLDDLEFSRTEIDKSAQTLARESQMMGDEIDKVSGRIKELEGRKTGPLQSKKMLDRLETLAKTVEKQRESTLGGMETEFETVSRQVQAYTQAQYQFQTINTRMEAMRGMLTQQGHELGDLSAALTEASTVYNKDLVEARDHLVEQKGRYAELEEKAKKVDFILGHLQELKAEGDSLSAKLSGIIKEANFVSSLGSQGVPDSMQGGKTSVTQNAAGSGMSDDRGPVGISHDMGSATGASSALGIGSAGAAAQQGQGAGATIGLPPELVSRIALTTAEEEEFEKKRQELGFLIRKMWEDDRQTGHGA